MTPDWTPLRWPSAWTSPAALSLLGGSAFNFILIDESHSDLIAEAKKLGITASTTPPAGVKIVDGEWPGVKLSRKGEDASAGPTGVPWVDSNGWLVRLAAALDPTSRIWVKAAPKTPTMSAGAYAMAVADAAAHGGRWIVSLDGALAKGILEKKPAALHVWSRIQSASGFFAARKDWMEYAPVAVVGILSDFAGANEFLSRELLNLTARTNQQYRAIVKTKPVSLDGLRALIYADAEPPSGELRSRAMAFVEKGGLLITGSRWGGMTGATASAHPRYSTLAAGKGHIAVAKAEPDDPYVLANDAVVLISHRYELLRFWNTGAVGSYMTRARDGSRVVAHLLFYAEHGPDRPTAWVAGEYKNAKLWTPGQSSPREVRSAQQRDGLELYLPEISQYGAVELQK